MGSVIRRPINTAKFLKLVEERSPARRYSSGLEVESSECAVCLSPYEEGEEIRRLKCKHTFHRSCLDTWLQQDAATCPLCRRTVLPEEVAVKHRRRYEEEEEEFYEGSGEGLAFLLHALHGNILSRFSQT
ncbi:hypothetical protein F511_42175 [Dorcoceras hygrometricum]|uniref:RING-type domain-containing protein n=1 Tax=Dorcoceras hygrometricum TaxID=472368 RepID=A0A2Z6ZZA6_9LAMI|nr:hypothetical protein F511_42175 [Dorcoceras hygrometricum]